MKNIILLIILSSMFVFHTHALQESCMTFGLSYKNRFAVTGDAIHSPGGSKGILGGNMNGFGFWDGKNIGIFAMAQILYPVYVTGVPEAPNINGYGSITEEIGIGVGFRHIITSRLTLLGGLGINFLMDIVNLEFYNENKYSNTMLDFGFLGEGALKLDITNVFCMIIGVYASYTFVNYTKEPSEWLLKSSIGINPFIGIGFNMYNQKYWGKPIKEE